MKTVLLSLLLLMILAGAVQMIFMSKPARAKTLLWGCSISLLSWTLIVMPMMLFHVAVSYNALDHWQGVFFIYIAPVLMVAALYGLIRGFGRIPKLSEEDKTKVWRATLLTGLFWLLLPNFINALIMR